MTVGQRIKQRRKELGMNAETLASLVGVTAATIYRYENGDIGNMNAKKLKPIAEALRTTPADLMGWSDEKPAVPEQLTRISLLAERLTPENRILAAEILEALLNKQ